MKSKEKNLIYMIIFYFSFNIKNSYINYFFVVQISLLQYSINILKYEMNKLDEL